MIKYHIFQVKNKFLVIILISPNITLKKKEQKNIIKNAKIILLIAMNAHLKNFAQNVKQILQWKEKVIVNVC